MGYTGYSTSDTQYALAQEMGSTEVLAASGNWRLWRNTHGYTGLTYFIVERAAGRVYVKGVDITEGPFATPPAHLARKLVAAHGGDVDAAGGHFGADLLRKALQPRRKVAKGDLVRVTKGAGHWAPGVGVAGDYRFAGGYRAWREGIGYVRLPRDWRTAWEWEVVAA